MTLRDAMLRHGSILTRLGHFGEEITYEPAEGGQLTVLAVVNRQGIEPLETGMPQVAVRRATIAIPKNESGVPTFAEGDRIVVAMTLGATAIRVRPRLVSDDEGMLTVEVQA